MFLEIDFSSGVPIYRQIMEQVGLAIAVRTLKPGDRLPSIRQLALELKVNPNTIVKAYSELEHDRVIETRRGMGTYVLEQTEKVANAMKRNQMIKLIEQLLRESTQLGFSREEIKSVFDDVVTRFYGVKENKGEER